MLKKQILLWQSLIISTSICQSASITQPESDHNNSDIRKLTTFKIFARALAQVKLPFQMFIDPRFDRYNVFDAKFVVLMNYFVSSFKQTKNKFRLKLEFLATIISAIMVRF